MEVTKGKSGQLVAGKVFMRRYGGETRGRGNAFTCGIKHDLDPK